MAKKKTSLKKWIILGALAVVVLAVVAVGARGGDKGIEVTIRKVELGDITAVVTATGKIQPQTEVMISSEVPGEIVELPVRDGDSVAKGDLLVRVNPITLDAQVKQQEAALSAAKALAAQRRAEMLQADLDLARAEDLIGKGFVTQSDVDQARTRVEVARAAHESALHQVDRQEMQLREARDQLAKASIYSPIDGTVVLVNSEIGDRVVGTGQFAGTEIMRVADLSRMEARVEVSEADIVNVAIGDAASVEVDAIPKEKFAGTVTQIANSAATEDARTQQQLTTFEVRVLLEAPGERLRPGMTATADIETDTVTGVVKAPLGAVVVRPKREVEGKGPADGEEPEGKGGSDGDGISGPGEGSQTRVGKEDRVRVVFTTDGKTARMRKVETGIADRDFIEITAGLEPGEEIITGSYRALTRELKDDSKVKRREEKKKDDDRKD